MPIRKAWPGVRSMAAVMLLVGASLSPAQTQTPAGKPVSPDPTNFNIETEMLTYRAVESNSEAVACDIAAYLHGVAANFNNPPAGTVCDVKGGSNSAKVILMAFDNNEFESFQIWRADMATMNRLQHRAESDCSKSKSGSGSSSSSSSSSTGSSGTSIAGTLLAMSPATGPLAMAQSALALMASQESLVSVGGNVEDQAFMNGVARELRALGVPVLMPTAYAPLALVPLDPAFSPFLASLDRTLNARECLAQIDTSKGDSQAEKVKRMIADIDAFLVVLTGASAALPTSGAASATPAPAPGATESKTPAKPAPAANTANALSHLNAVLSADGLAQKLGVQTDTGTLPDGGLSEHILLVKALESGGAVTRRSNAIRTSVRYSGGAVGTYALFTADGDLECSGNVYDYAGDIGSKEFRRDFRNFHPEPSKQMIFLRGGCRSTAAH